MYRGSTYKSNDANDVHVFFKMDEKGRGIKKHIYLFTNGKLIVKDSLDELKSDLEFKLGISVIYADKRLNFLVEQSRMLFSEFTLSVINFSVTNFYKNMYLSIGEILSSNQIVLANILSSVSNIFYSKKFFMNDFLE